MKIVNIKQDEKTYIANTYARFELVAESGEGAVICDQDGKSYIDLGSGIAVNSFGINDKQWLDAVTAQASKLQHLSNLYYTEPQVKLAKLLSEKTGLRCVFFSNSGAEANECAIKTARKYSSDKYGEGRGTVVTLLQGFHGRTLATLSASGQPEMHKHFAPFTPGFAHVPANDIEAMKEALSKDDVCGVMLELVQGEGGVIALDKEYVSAVSELALSRDVLLILDEVQTGNGRTGTLYAYEQYGITPDIITTAKGLAGGLPLGACMLGEKVKDTLTPGSHGSTFGGNPVCCAGALSILSRLDDTMLAGIRERGEIIRKSLEGAAGVTDISGLGMMVGIGVSGAAKEIAAECLEKGVIVLTAHEKVRLLPPLNIPINELQQALEIVKSVVARHI